MITIKEMCARHVIPGDTVDGEDVITVKYHLGKVILRFEDGDKEYNDTSTLKVTRVYSSL
jgi:hypothetical protein